MVDTVQRVDLRALQLAPKNPLPYRQQVKAIRAFHTGLETLRDAGGPVTRLALAPRWLMPPVVCVTSPQGARDILGRSGGLIEKTRIHHEMRYLLGPNLFDLTHEPWLPRRRALQPIFTKQHVREFGGHMAEAAERAAAGWVDGANIELRPWTHRWCTP
jgi:cytochrome P450